MSRRDRAHKTRAASNPNEVENILSFVHPLPKIKPFKYLNAPQRLYGNAIETFPLVFGLGPAGTGKTYVCGALAAEALKEKRIEKIIITRPAVEAGESLGYLPGTKEEKYEPWLQPFRDVLHERLGKSAVDYHLNHGKIEGAPLAYMRGRTFKNAFVIMDEAQNATPAQMQMFLTRIGDNCTVIVNGDLNQTDLPGISGLAEALRILSAIQSIKVITFKAADSVRSGLCKEICEAYEQDKESGENEDGPRFPGPISSRNKPHDVSDTPVWPVAPIDQPLSE